MIRHRLFFMTAALFITARALGVDNSIPEATPESFVGGPENLRLVAAAKSISVFRIVDPEQKPKNKKLVTIDGFKCDAAPSVVNGPEVPELIHALSDMTNFGGALICDFDPGVIFRFAARGHTLDLVICFHCGDMVLYHDNAIIQRPYKWAPTQNTFRKDAERAFAAIAVKAFPKDKEIQKLKE